MKKLPIRIAIADDHPLLRKGICDILKETGEFAIAIEAGDGEELIQSLKTARALPDICIVDINMPVMDGYETVKQLKAAWPAMKILVLSLYENEFSIIKMLRLGVNGYLCKSSGLEEMLVALRSVHASGEYYSSMVAKYALKYFAIPIAELSINNHDKEFLAYCCSDLTYKEIADKLSKSLNAIEWQRDLLFKKLRVKTRTGLAVSAMKMGIVPLTGQSPA